MSIPEHNPRPENCLDATFYMNYEHPAVREFAAAHAGSGGDDKALAIRLYNAVRDEIRYNPYSVDLRPPGMQASTSLTQGEGFCINKAVLLAALLRAHGIPARLGFADVKNHLASQRLLDGMGTDLFVYHGYADVYLDGKWVKATPAFNISLCEKFGVLPLEFDGENDSIFHPFDKAGRQHMEYVHDHGAYADLPLDDIQKSWRAHYPKMTELWEMGAATGDFEAEAAAEKDGAVRLSPAS